MFRSVDTIQNMDTPLLVIGGEEDLVTPVEHSRKLFEAAKHCLPKRLECVQAMAHNNVRIADSMTSCFRTFISQKLQAACCVCLEIDCVLVCRCTMNHSVIR